MTQRVPTANPWLVRRTAVAIGVLVTVVMGFAAIRMAIDWPNIVAGTTPSDDDFAERYVARPWLANLHIAPGVVYLL